MENDATSYNIYSQPRSGKLSRCTTSLPQLEFGDAVSMQAFVKTWMMKMRRDSQANSISWFEFIGHLTIIRGKDTRTGKREEKRVGGRRLEEYRWNQRDLY